MKKAISLAISLAIGAAVAYDVTWYHGAFIGWLVFAVLGGL